MPNDLPIPLDLNHLIEKREQDEQRKAERRSDDVKPNPSLENISEMESDRRTGKDRRTNNRRKANDHKD